MDPPRQLLRSSVLVSTHVSRPPSAAPTPPSFTPELAQVILETRMSPASFVQQGRLSPQEWRRLWVEKFCAQLDAHPSDTINRDGYVRALQAFLADNPAPKFVPAPKVVAFARLHNAETCDALAFFYQWVVRSDEHVLALQQARADAGTSEGADETSTASVQGSKSVPGTKSTDKPTSPGPKPAPSKDEASPRTDAPAKKKRKQSQ